MQTALRMPRNDCKGVPQDVVDVAIPRAVQACLRSTVGTSGLACGVYDVAYDADGIASAKT